MSLKLRIIGSTSFEDSQNQVKVDCFLTQLAGAHYHLSSFQNLKVRPCVENMNELLRYFQLLRWSYAVGHNKQRQFYQSSISVTYFKGRIWQTVKKSLRLLAFSPQSNLLEALPRTGSKVRNCNFANIYRFREQNAQAQTQRSSYRGQSHIISDTDLCWTAPDW